LPGPSPSFRLDSFPSHFRSARRPPPPLATHTKVRRKQTVNLAQAPPGGPPLQAGNPLARTQPASDLHNSFGAPAPPPVPGAEALGFPLSWLDGPDPPPLHVAAWHAGAPGAAARGPPSPSSPPPPPPALPSRSPLLLQGGGQTRGSTFCFCIAIPIFSPCRTQTLCCGFFRASHSYELEVVGMPGRGCPVCPWRGEMPEGGREGVAARVWPGAVKAGRQFCTGR